MKLKRASAAAAVLVISAALCSCGGNEPNDVAFVVALGFDKGTQSEYEITIQFAKADRISGGASESGGEPGSEIIQNVAVEAPDIYSAINTANHIVSKKFSLSHAKLLVFSRALAEEGIGDIADTMIRSNEIKPDVYIAVAKDTANGYLEEVKPVVEVNPAKYYRLIYGENDSGGLPKTNLLNFYFNKETNRSGSVVPLAGVTETNEEGMDNAANKNAPVNDRDFEFQVKNYTAGEVAVDGENKSEAMGMAVFSGDRMTGVLGSVDCELYNLLSGELKRSYISFRSGGGAAVVKLFRYKKPQYDIDIKRRHVAIKLFLESDLYSVPRGAGDIEETERDITRAVNEACEEFIVRARDELDCDILGIESRIGGSFLTVDERAGYDFWQEFKEYTVEVDTAVEVRRAGMKS